jgi:glycosyltransferase involved in cell wall biosynthesis
MREVREVKEGATLGVTTPDRSCGLRVVHALAPAPFGGLESVVRTLAAGQAAAGDRVLIVAVGSSGKSPCPFTEAAQARGLSVTPVQVVGRRYWAERKAVQRILEEFQADLLHTHGYRPDMVDAPVARMMGIPSVTTVHGFTGGGVRNHLYERLQKWCFRRFDAVVAVSGRLRQELVSGGLRTDRVHVIQNAWEPGGTLMRRMEARKRLGLPERTKVIAWVGRMSPEKGPDLIIRAFAGMEPSHAHLSMIGAGPSEWECRNLADALGIRGRCHWHGTLPEVASLLPAFDVVAITSRTEGTPMVLLEAMAAGVPIVATSVGGIPDVVSPSEAKLVPPGDIPGLVAALEEVLGDPPAAAERSRAAKHRLERDFAVPQWVARYRQVYESVLGR